MNVADSELLRLYRETGDQDAFSRLLTRHVDLVYSAALRQTLDDPSAAEEVTQTVFADLARKSARLMDHPCLSGWLYSSARLAAAEYRRGEGRRRIREARFAAMIDVTVPPTPPPEWNQIRPVLDDAMQELSDPDRDAVVLRYFDGQSHAEIGRRMGVSENAARMRISRALETLRLALGKRGVVSAADALGLLLAQHAVTAAPAGLVARIGPRLHVGSGAVVPISRSMYRTTAGVWTAVVAVVGLLTVTGVWTGARLGRSAAPDPGGAFAAGAMQTSAVGDPADNDRSTTSGDAGPAGTLDRAAGWDSGRFLILSVVAKDSGIPIPNVLLDHRLRTEPGPRGFSSRQVATTRAGVAWIRVPTNVLLMEVTTRTEGFADTRLRWEPPLGQRIPTNYVLRLERAVTLGGQVVDAEGQPVVGAKVVIYLEPKASEIRGAESHEFDSVSAVTGDEGRWTLTRLAPEVIGRCRVSASHPDHQPAESIDLASAPEVEKALRQQRNVLRLAPGRVLRGTVVDDGGQGISDARVVIRFPTSRETLTSADGEFELSGTPIGNHWMNVTAPGFAPARFPVRSPPPGEAIRLELKRAGIVRLRVLNVQGQPVSNARFGFSVNPWETSPEPGFPDPPPPAEFVDLVDADGRGVWTNAPTGIPKFDVIAEGYEPRFSVAVAADGLEHPVVLERAANLVVYGEVKNAETGRTIPSFRMVLGCLWMDVPDKWRVGFIEEERSRLRFEGGQFRHSFTEPLMRGNGDSRVVVKFEADGFQPWFSSPLPLDAGDVHLEVSLKPAEDFWVTVLLPDGRPAEGADVGTIRIGERLWLDGPRFSRSRWQDPAAFRSADSLGRVRLSREEGVTCVKFAHPGGFASAPLDSLTDGAKLNLQPWSQIEVEFTGTDTAIHRAWVHLADFETADLDLDYGMSQMTADEHGRCLFATIPPGEWDVSQVRPVVRSNGPTTSQSGTTTRVQLGAGKTVRVEFSERGYRVSGKIRIPAGMSVPPHAQWSGSLSWTHTDSPSPPREILGNREALSFWRQQPGIRQGIAIQDRRRRWVGVTADMGFVADSVEPGDYQLHLSLVELPEVSTVRVEGAAPRVLLTVQRTIHVPSEPDSGVLDLGWISAEANPPTVSK